MLRTELMIPADSPPRSTLDFRPRDGQPQRCPRQKACRVQDWQGRVRLFDEERQLRAAENHGVASLLSEPLDDGSHLGTGLGSQDALDQFLEDELVDALSFARVGEIVLQVRPLKARRVDRPVHENARPQNTESAVARFLCLRRHDLRYVKPWTWGLPRPRGQTPDGSYCPGR